MIGILTLGIHKGSVIEVTVDGSDEKEAMDAILTLAAANFNEEE